MRAFTPTFRVHLAPRANDGDEGRAAGHPRSRPTRARMRDRAGRSEGRTRSRVAAVAAPRGHPIGGASRRWCQQTPSRSGTIEHVRGAGSRGTSSAKHVPSLPPTEASAVKLLHTKQLNEGDVVRWREGAVEHLGTVRMVVSEPTGLDGCATPPTVPANPPHAAVATHDGETVWVPLAVLEVVASHRDQRPSA